jgi:hypothetical protein
MSLSTAQVVVGTTDTTIYTAAATVTVSLKASAPDDNPVVLAQYRAGAVVTFAAIPANPNPTWTLQNGDVIKGIVGSGEVVVTYIVLG